MNTVPINVFKKGVDINSEKEGGENASLSNATSDAEMFGKSEFGGNTS